MRLIAGLVALGALAAAPALAQSPDNVLLVINERSPASVEVGEYYANAYALATDHVARIQTSTEESISFELFVKSIEAPLAVWITKHALHDRVLYIVLTKGVPIRVLGTAGREGTVASVDSELTLLYRKLVGSPTSIVGRQKNPYFLDDKPIENAVPFSRDNADIYLVTRLDGFTVADAKGLVDRGRAPSTTGRFVLDQRGNLFDAGGDRWLQQSAERLEAAGGPQQVLLEMTRQVATFDGPALGYYSWGSNDAAHKQRGSGLTFSPGAIAGMFVSTDGRTFREPPADWLPGPSNRPPSMFGSGSQSVAADLIREGVTGMAAHVEEPFLDATVRPQVLFPAYRAGFNLAESYYLAMPFLSWQNIVLGDPLCAPFRTAALSASQIHRGIDPDTELPSIFAQRRLELLSRDGLKLEALKLLLRSGVLAARGNDDGAETLLRQAVDLEPRLIAGGLQLAMKYEARGEYDRAIAEYRRVLEVNPKELIALNNLAYALAVRKGELTEALALAKRAFAVDALPTVSDTLAWIQHLLGDDAAAKTLIEQAALAAPREADIQLHAAFIHAALGETARARAELDAAIELNPTLADRPDVKTLRQKIGGSPGTVHLWN